MTLVLRCFVWWFEELGWRYARLRCCRYRSEERLAGFLKRIFCHQISRFSLSFLIAKSSHHYGVQLFHKGHGRHAFHRNHTRMMAMLMTRNCPIVYSYTEILQGILGRGSARQPQKGQGQIKNTSSRYNERNATRTVRKMRSRN
jgi:hypothetical protein